MNPIKSTISAGRASIGTWIQLGHPGIAEVLSGIGFDWIAADMEHSDITMNQFAHLCRGMYGRGPVPLARVKENDDLSIRQVLDLGARGVIVPLVNNADEATNAVAAAKYPPVGVRGFAFTRSNDYGAGFDSYVREANDDVLVIAMVETREAVENVESILDVDGLDGIFLGPYDLSGSYGIPGKVDDPILKTAFRRCVEACASKGKSAGIHIVSPQDSAIEEAIRSGFTFIALGIDHRFMHVGAREALAAARRFDERIGS